MLQSSDPFDSDDKDMTTQNKLVCKLLLGWEKSNEHLQMHIDELDAQLRQARADAAEARACRHAADAKEWEFPAALEEANEEDEELSRTVMEQKWRALSPDAARSLKKRARDKILGKLKYHLIADKGFEDKDVKIFWKAGIIKLKGEKVATIGDGPFDVTTTGAADDLKDMVLEKVRSRYDERARRWRWLFNSRVRPTV